MRGGSSVGQTGLLLGDSLFSKELENMGKQLAGRQLYVYVCVLYVCVRLYVILAIMMNCETQADQKASFL